MLITKSTFQPNSIAIILVNDLKHYFISDTQTALLTFADLAMMKIVLFQPSKAYFYDFKVRDYFDVRLSQRSRDQ